MSSLIKEINRLISKGIFVLLFDVFNGIAYDQDLRPGTWDPGTLRHGTLTPRNLEMSLWDLEIATLRPRILRTGP